MDPTTIATIIAALIGAVGAVIAALVSRHSNKSDPLNKSVQPATSNKNLTSSDTPKGSLKLSEQKKLEAKSSSSLAKIETKENPRSTSSEKASKRRVIIVDSQDVKSELSVYGIVYNPYGSSNPWFFASRSGINIVRGASSESIAWDKISRVEITDTSPTLKGKIFFRNGTIIGDAELTSGTFWGETDWGSSLLIHLSKLKLIGFDD